MPTIAIAKGTTDITASVASIANGDTLLFADGSQTITTGLAVAALTGLSTGLAAVITRPTFTGSIGGAAGSLTVDVDDSSTGKLTHQGSGFFYFNAGGGSARSNRSINTGSGQLYLTGGTHDNAESRGGRLYVNGSAVVTTLWTVGGECTILANATAITTAHVYGGARADINRTCTTLNVGGANTMVNFFAENASGTLPTVGTLNAYGGRIIYKGGTISTLNGFDGSIDFSQAPQPVTISAIGSITDKFIRESNWTNAVLPGSYTRRAGVNDSTIAP